MTKTGHRRKKLSPGFVPLRDLVPRNDPKGGSPLKTVFGEPPLVFDANEKQPSQPAERRPKPGHGRNRRKGEQT